jgi:hypothetical protein
MICPSYCLADLSVVHVVRHHCRPLSPSLYARAHFVTTGAVDLNFVHTMYVPLGQMTSQTKVWPEIIMFQVHLAVNCDIMSCIALPWSEQHRFISKIIIIFSLIFSDDW